MVQIGIHVLQADIPMLRRRPEISLLVPEKGKAEGSPRKGKQKVRTRGWRMLPLFYRKLGKGSQLGRQWTRAVSCLPLRAPPVPFS